MTTSESYALAALRPPEGGIASRILLKTGSGSATAFAFAEGEGLDEHSSPREALLVVTDGEARVTLGGEAYDLAAGETIRLPASEPHAVHAITEARLLLVLLRP